MNRRVLVLITLALLIYSCKKQDIDPADPSTSIKLKSIFDVSKNCNYLLYADTIQLVDSLILFSNSSFLIGEGDTNSLKSYKWDFGDGTSSIENNTTHSYSNSGIFNVKLTTFLNNQPSDSTYRKIRIILSQKQFTNQFQYTYVSDMDGGSDKQTLVLARSYTSGSTNTSYSILKVDSLLKKRWWKTIPGADIRLSSLKRINDNEYILSGNLLSGYSNVFCITKIDSSGNLIWQKPISNIIGENKYTLPTSDGGFITIGNSGVSEICTIVKFNSAGIELWRKIFNSSMQIKGAENIIETTDGYLFASIILGVLNSQIVLTKIDFSGNVLQQNSTTSDLGATIATAGVSIAGSNVLVYSKDVYKMYLFSLSTNFVTSYHNNQASNHIMVNGSDFYISQGDIQSSQVFKFNISNPLAGWLYTINHQFSASCSSVSSGIRYCKQTLHYGNDILVASDGNNDDVLGNSSSLFLEKISLDGYIK